MIKKEIGLYLHSVKNEVSKTKYAQIKVALSKLSVFLMEEKTNEIDLNLIRDKFYKHLCKKDFASTTIVLTFYNLKYFLNYLKVEGLIDFNTEEIMPSDLLKNYYKRKKETHAILNKKEIEIIISFWNRKSNDMLQVRNNLIMRLLFKYGLRTNEVINIKISDLDFTKKKILIKESFYVNKRYVELSTEDVALIKDYLEIRNTDIDYLFVQKRHLNNKPITVRTIQRIVKEAINNLNINKKIVPRDGRYIIKFHSYIEGKAIKNTAQKLGLKESKSLFIKPFLLKKLGNDGYVPLNKYMKEVDISDHYLTRHFKELSSDKEIIKIQCYYYLKLSSIEKIKAKVRFLKGKSNKNVFR